MVLNFISCKTIYPKKILNIKQKKCFINIKVILSKLEFLMCIYMLNQKEQEVSFNMKILYQRLWMIVEIIEEQLSVSFIHLFVYFWWLMVMSFVFILLW